MYTHVHLEGYDMHTYTSTVWDTYRYIHMHKILIHMYKHKHTHTHTDAQRCTFVHMHANAYTHMCTYKDAFALCRPYLNNMHHLFFYMHSSFHIHT